MKNPIVYKTEEEIPLFLDAKRVAALLCISTTACYDIMHQEDFPTIFIGNRMLVKKDQLFNWIAAQT